MATYRLWLTIKDSNGKTKEIDGGTVNIDLTKLTETEVDTLTTVLDPLYATEKELEDAISGIPLEEVVEVKVPEVIVQDTVVQEKIVETVANNLTVINYEPFVSNEKEATE